ncbi:coiled-coil domain-containing protein [Paenibacillus tarimensis]|uniref:hypothetical protein n=1 Tax=Paenibacillus tarimensis TaxID=416012 RepID=UPI001F43BAF1|nr:hypothetical protein [Paenibacillus tarimensis]MCF2945228.1 hypothetical protein [Paenibacillus tarimensis]
MWFVVFLLITSFATDLATAQSINISEMKNSALKAQRGKEINQFLSDLSAKKARIKALKRRVSEVNSSSTSADDIKQTTDELNTLNKEIRYKETNMRQIIGLVEIDPSDYGVVFPLSDGKVTFTGTMYYDTIFSNSWVVSVDYEWANREYLNQKSGDGNLGGYEGFTVGLNRQILTHSTSAYVYDYWEGQSQDNVTFYEDYSNYGRSWKWQDKINAGKIRNYNSHSGNFNIYFEFATEPSSGNKTQYHGTYAHTWNTTSISSLGIGPYSATIGWSNEGYNWSDASQWIYTH